jgi:AcrR family transcriptional regulator
MRSARIARKQDQRREGILKVGAEVFGELGYHRTSLEEIADRVDLTRAALYHYFPSKDVLLSACLEYGAEQAISRLQQVFESTVGQSADARLAALIQTQLTIINSDSREVSRLFLNPMDWPETFRSQVKRMRDRHDKFFRNVISDGIASGEFNCIDVEVAHHCLHGAINYSAVWMRPQRTGMAKSIDHMVASLLLLFHAPA